MMKIRGKLKTALAAFGGFALIVSLTAGFTGFDIIRLAGGIIQDSGGNTRITLATSGTEITLTGDISLAGTINQPSQPSFFVLNSVTDDNVTGDGTIATVDFDTEVRDTGGNFASDTFTGPDDGDYLLCANPFVRGIGASHTEYSVRIVTSNRTYNVSIIDAGGGLMESQNQPLTVIADMDANDTATVAVDAAGDTKTVDIFGNAAPFTFFSGTLLN